MVRFQKLTRNLFLTLHGHNIYHQQQQQQLSKFLIRYQQFASHAYCGAAGPVSKMASQQEKATPSLRWIWLPCAYVSCDPGCTYWRILMNAWEAWTDAGAPDCVSCACVRWEINFSLTFETAPFFCVYPVFCFKIFCNIISLLCIVSDCNKFLLPYSLFTSGLSMSEFARSIFYIFRIFPGFLLILCIFFLSTIIYAKTVP